MSNHQQEAYAIEKTAWVRQLGEDLRKINPKLGRELITRQELLCRLSPHLPLILLEEQIGKLYLRADNAQELLLTRFTFPYLKPEFNIISPNLYTVSTKVDGVKEPIFSLVTTGSDDTAVIITTNGYEITHNDSPELTTIGFGPSMFFLVNDSGHVIKAVTMTDTKPKDIVDPQLTELLIQSLNGAGLPPLTQIIESRHSPEKLVALFQ